MYIHSDRNTSTPPPLASDEEDDEQNLQVLDETESGSSNHNFSEDEETRVTGLDSPTTKVWDCRTNRSSSVSHIHHPLESLDGKLTRRTRGQYQRLPRQQSGQKRSRLGSQKVPMWQEVERTSFLPGDGQDIHPLKQQVKEDDSSDEYDMEIMGRLQSGATASSSAYSLPESFSLSANSPQTAFLRDAFFKLRCEVLGANIVRSSSKTFAVYSISVIDAENNSWSIKRRYRHFEELHGRLKEYPEYSLHLPPKHFLSTLDVPVIRERCKLLDEYLKILWPDGIFITKHPKRQKPSGSGTPSQSALHNKLPDQISSPREEADQKLVEQQEKEAEERAKFIYELMIENAPAAIISLVGRKEYEQCAKDLYFFLQLSICLKQLVVDLLQLVLLYAFPELDDNFKQLREEKHKFGEFMPT